MNAAVSLAVLQLTDRDAGGIRAGVAMDMGVVDGVWVWVMAEVMVCANYGGEGGRRRKMMDADGGGRPPTRQMMDADGEGGGLCERV